MKYYTLLTLAALFFITACGITTRSSSNYQGAYNTRSYQSKGSGLPANPDPNKCYVRGVTLDVYETDTLKYLTYSELESLDYPHKEVKVVTMPETSNWETTQYEGCDSDDPNDCQVLCYRTHPEQYEIIFEPVDQSLGSPYWKKIVRSTLLEKGGVAAYEEIDCALTSYSEFPVEFADQSAALSETARMIVDDYLLELLVQQPNLHVQISAHTSALGSDAKNQLLSERRAKSIADYLVSHGILSPRLVTNGYGESQLKNRCADGVNCSEEEHAVNSRVEFRVLSVAF